FGRGIGLVAVQARGRVAGDRFREQVDLLVWRSRKDVDELDRRAVERRRDRSVLEQFSAYAFWHPAGDSQQRFGIVLGRADPEPFGQLREDFRVRPRLALRLDDGANQLEADRSV